VTVLTGVGEVEKNSTITLYPNPNDGMFTVSAEGLNGKEIKVEILTITGQAIVRKEVKVHNGRVTEQVNLGNAANGIYLLRLYDDERQQTLRFRISR
jgi:hypothetical protein